MGFTEDILESVDLLTSQKISEAGYDSTIQAIIVSCEDESLGKYKVKYQDSIFYAYAENIKDTYRDGVKVYILIPSSDFSKTKKIVGSVSNLGDDYVSIVQGSEESYDKVGINFINSGENRFGLCSYNGATSLILYDVNDINNSPIHIDEISAQTYMSKSEYFIIAANFETMLDYPQRSKGSYGLRYTIEYTDKASKDLRYRTYEFSSADMLGQIYALPPTRQYKTFCFTGLQYQRILKIEFFVQDFPLTEVGKPLDIFCSKFETYAATPIPEEALTNYHVTISTPNGSIFLASSAIAELPLVAALKKDGKVVNDNVQYYWFKEDLSIKTTSDRYHQYGGVGWRCLNEYVEKENEFGSYEKEWKADSNTYVVEKDTVFSEFSNFKCVCFYNDILTSNYQEIINNDYTYSITLTSSEANENGVIAFVNGIGEADIHCVVKQGNEIVNKDILTFSWGKKDAYGNTELLSSEELTKKYNYYLDYVTTADEYIRLNQDKPDLFIKEKYPHYDEYKEFLDNYNTYFQVDNDWLRNVSANMIDSMATYTCTVFFNEEQLGSASILVTNGQSTGGYTLNYEAPPLFKYSEAGVAPTSDSYGSNKLILKPLKFILLDSQGNTVSDEQIRTAWNVSWYVPKNDTMIEIDSEHAEISEDNEWYIIDNQKDLVYTINSIYYRNKNNNTVKLIVSSQESSDIVLTTYINFVFTKEGSIGTNGTDYSVIISINSYKPNSLTAREDVPMLFIKNSDYAPMLEPINFNTDSNQQWLKFSFWHNGVKIFEGTDKNIINGYNSLKTTEGKEISGLRWEMLGESYYRVTENGNFSNNIVAGSLLENPCNIVKVSFLYNKCRYSATLPIASIICYNNDIFGVMDTGGFTSVLYNANGYEPSYDITLPFKVNVSEKTLLADNTTVYQDIESGIDFIWEVGGTEPALQIDSKTSGYGERWYSPIDTYYSASATSAVIVKSGLYQWKDDDEWISTRIDIGSFTEEQNNNYIEFLNRVEELKAQGLEPEQLEQGIAQLVDNYQDKVPFYFNIYTKIHFPIYFSINKYSSVAINDWDGDIYSLNADKDVLLIPQVGAGRKESDNSFTGVVMGVVDNLKKETCTAGLFGYNQGQRTFLLDSKDGKLEIGTDKARMVFDPSYKTGEIKATISSNYDLNNKTGMEIDFFNSTIKYGNGNFSVDEEGYLRAKEVEVEGIINAKELNASGCFIGNFEIFKNALMMNPSQAAKDDFYDASTYTWNFDIELEEGDHDKLLYDDLAQKRVRNSADIYFGPKGLNIGKTSSINQDAYFQVDINGTMTCRNAIILNAAQISSYSIDANSIQVEKDGNVLAKIDKDGNLLCQSIHVIDGINGEHGDDGQSQVSGLTGTSLTLKDGSLAYLTIDKRTSGNTTYYSLRGDENFLVDLRSLLSCVELSVNENCIIDKEGNITAKKVYVDELETSVFNINNYIFTSSTEYYEPEKELGNVAIQQGKILAFSSDKVTEDLALMPRIVGYYPYEEESQIIKVDQPTLEFRSGYNIAINSENKVEVKTSESGTVSFQHTGVDETGANIAEEYANISKNGFSLHGGDVLFSMIDGTYNIPYPQKDETYSKIFTLDGYTFSTIYIENGTVNEQTIDLQKHFTDIPMEDISVQVMVNTNLKGVVTSVSEILELDPSDETHAKKIRVFYINYSKEVTPELFNDQDITMHWSILFFHK